MKPPFNQMIARQHQTKDARIAGYGQSGPAVRCVHEGAYVAEVDVELEFNDGQWSPYLSLQDACKLDDVREALRRGDASRNSRVREPVALCASR